MLVFREMTIFATRFSDEMEKENEYLIPVSGLAIGTHSYRYEIGDDFFAGMDYSEVKHGNVVVRLDIDRAETMLTLSFDIEGSVQVTCDRCAEEFDIPIGSEQTFYIKLNTENAEEADDIAVIAPDQRDYDIRPLIYEYIILSIPIHRVHPEGQCNPKVLDLLGEHKTQDSEEPTETDPRWSALKDIHIDEN